MTTYGSRGHGSALPGFAPRSIALHRPALPRLALRGCGSALAALLLLAGCSDGTEKPSASGTPSGAASPGGGASPGSPGGTASPGGPGGTASPGASRPAAPLLPPLDEAKQPGNAAEGRTLLARIAIGPASFGPTAARSNPAESAPNRWPVLDQNCVWQTAGLPADVLATRTQYFHVPAQGDRGLVRLNATVTIHRNRTESGWETARAMEEVLRCPNQKLRDGEELRSLYGNVLYQGEQLVGWTEDAFTESGQYVSGGAAPQSYSWSQGQYGPVTIAVAVKGAPGYTPAELTRYVAQGTSDLMLLAKQELGKAAG
ncbi:hypothetical protein [Streptomyces sp. NPDC051211]|uniref:hypothetical protein n=1 Tax=Streptomyces sp. NPDC051211 TaxID=3154643 RepID=UPI00344B1AD3